MFLLVRAASDETQNAVDYDFFLKHFFPSVTLYIIKPGTKIAPDRLELVVNRVVRIFIV